MPNACLVHSVSFHVDNKNDAAEISDLSVTNVGNQYTIGVAN